MIACHRLGAQDITCLSFDPQFLVLVWLQASISGYIFIILQTSIPLLGWVPASEVPRLSISGQCEVCLKSPEGGDSGVDRWDVLLGSVFTVL